MSLLLIQQPGLPDNEVDGNSDDAYKEGKDPPTNAAHAAGGGVSSDQDSDYGSDHATKKPLHCLFPSPSLVLASP